MKKKGWALLLTAALLGTVCGCGGAEEPGSAGAAGSAAPAVQQEEPPAEETAEITLAFAGDVNLDDSWCVMQHLRSQGGDLSACIDPALIQRMNAADLCCVNNEFAFSDRGAPMAGKAYTFRSRPENVSIWNTLGVDVATLANNHVFDYGGEAFSDTLDTLQNAGIDWVGAGRNLEEAMTPAYYELDGRRWPLSTPPGRRKTS